MAREELSRLVQARQGIRNLSARAADQVAAAFRGAKDARQLERGIIQALRSLPPFLGADKARENPDWNAHELLSRADVRAAARVFIARHLAYKGPVRDASAFPDVSPFGLGGLYCLLSGEAALQLPVPHPSQATQLNEADAYLWSLFPWILKPAPKLPSPGWAAALDALPARDALALARALEAFSRRAWPESSAVVLTPIGLRWSDCTAFRGLRRALVRERMSRPGKIESVPSFLSGMLVLTRREGGEGGKGVLTFQVPGVPGCPIGLCAMAAEGALMADARRREGAEVASYWAEVARALIASCRHPKAHLLMDF